MLILFVNYLFYDKDFYVYNLDLIKMVVIFIISILLYIYTKTKKEKKNPSPGYYFLHKSAIVSLHSNLTYTYCDIFKSNNNLVFDLFPSIVKS